MQLLRKCVTFTKNIEELKNIYILFIRSILEQSCVLWHSSLTLEDSNNLDRVQKSSFRIILQEDYEDYEKILQQVNLQSLYERRISLCETLPQILQDKKVYTHSSHTIIITPYQKLETLKNIMLAWL